MSKRVADLLVETLQAAGVKTCYGIVGDTLNQIAHAIDRSEIDWVHVRHEEAGAFAAGAEAQLTGHLTACAGSCGPGSLHFINGLYEANRNRAPVILIASQIVRQAGELEDAVRAWLAHPGPAVLDVKVKPMQPVTPPSPFVSPEAVVGMAVYSAKAMLHGKGHDVWEMLVENIP